MAELIGENPLGDNFLWSANIQNDAKEPLYVDNVSLFCRFFEANRYGYS